MAELDDVDRIISGEVERVVTEWGVRYDNGEVHAANEKMARGWYDFQSKTEVGRAWGVTLVKRQVTYGAWQDA